MVEAILRRTLKRVVDLASMHSITSDALIAMSKDDYQVLRRAATRAARQESAFRLREMRTCRLCSARRPDRPALLETPPGCPTALSLVDGDAGQRRYR